MIDIYYDFENKVLKNKLDITNSNDLEKAESDILSIKIREIEEQKKFELSEKYFRYIHKYLFENLYDFAGAYRKINIEKSEMILGGLTVKYGNHEKIIDDIKNIIEDIKKTDLDKLSKKDKINHIIDLMINLWKVHPFREGNTRCVVIFICKYLESLGIKFNNQIFKENAAYVRKSLVAASFEDEELGILANKEYLLEVIKDMIN
jgi:Protein involved in cell division